MLPRGGRRDDGGRGRERRCRLAKLGEGFLCSDSISFATQGWRSPGRGLTPWRRILRGSRSCFLGPKMLLCEAKLAALCRGALSGDALARTGRCSVSVARIAALQGLPLLRRASADCCKGLPLVELFLSKRSSGARIEHGAKIRPESRRDAAPARGRTMDIDRPTERDAPPVAKRGTSREGLYLDRLPGRAATNRDHRRKARQLARQPPLASKGEKIARDAGEGTATGPDPDAGRAGQASVGPEALADGEAVRRARGEERRRTERYDAPPSPARVRLEERGGAGRLRRDGGARRRRRHPGRRSRRWSAPRC